MRVNASPFRVTLRWGVPLTVKDGQGACITSRRGTVWITQDHDRRDVVLTSGESFRLERPDTAIVQAMDTAEVLILPPAPQPGQDGALQGSIRSMVAKLLQRVRGESDRRSDATVDVRSPALDLSVAGRQLT